MSIFIGTNAGDTITPDLVSAGVIAIGGKKPSSGSDLILAGSGNDIVAGGGGDDLAFLGGGDDTFIWKSGDGSDIVDGGSGNDRLAFSGSAAAENITVSAGLFGLARVTRDVGNVTMTLASVERIDIAALDGADRITVNDLSHTDVKEVSVDLAGTANPGAGDGQADLVTVNGTAAADLITVALNGASVLVSGLAARTTVDHADAGADRLVIAAGAGDDVITASNGLSTSIQLTLDGGSGNDTLTGGDGADQLIGGDGNDFINGGRGSDSAQLGSGDDTFVWNPGDGSDVVDGGAGNDTLQFNGSNVGEDMVLSASGSHALLTRNVGAITMDLNGIETVNIAALGGADNIVVGDLRGTDVGLVHVDLGAFDGSDDALTDTVTVALTAADDTFAFAVPFGTAEIDGLGARVVVDHMGVGDRLGVDGGAGNDAVTANGTSGDDVIGIARDGTASIAIFSGNGPVIDITNVEQLLVQGGAGNDTITGQNGIATLTHLTIDGGAGNDTLIGGDGADQLIGGDGNDFINGGRGNDNAQLGAGDDTFVWNPGDGSDVVDGGAGSDTLQFNGSNVGEDMVLSANGSHALFTRNVGTVTMDLNGIETVNVAALGGADNITIGDMTGSGVQQIHVDLGGFGGADDGSADVVNVAFTTGDDAIDFNVQAGPAVIDSLGGTQVFVDNQGVGDSFAIDGGAGNDSATANGTNGDDIISLAFDGTGVAVFAQGGQAISVTNVEQLLVEGGAGNDTIVGQNGIATLTHLTLDGGAGNDTLTGGDGDDTLLGGDGNDLVAGGRGNDTALLGNGDDTFTWNPGDGSDIVEGQAGTDTMQFNGANIAENVDISANGERVRFTRDVANITMDLHDVEHINFNALGGADNVTVNDLTGTGVTQVNLDLGANVGGSDGQLDNITVNGTSGNDVITLSMRDGALVVGGLAEEVVIKNFDPTDVIHIAGLGGDDIIDASALGAGGPKIALDGGVGDDLLLGGAGDDVLSGGEGDDILLGGAGNDVLDGGPGANVVIQDSAAPVASLSQSDFGTDPQAAVDHDPVASPHVDHSLL